MGGVVWGVVWDLCVGYVVVLGLLCFVVAKVEATDTSCHFNLWFLQ